MKNLRVPELHSKTRHADEFLWLSGRSIAICNQRVKHTGKCPFRVESGHSPQ